MWVEWKRNWRILHEISMDHWDDDEQYQVKCSHVFYVNTRLFNFNRLKLISKHFLNGPQGAVFVLFLSLVHKNFNKRKFLHELCDLCHLFSMKLHSSLLFFEFISKPTQQRPTKHVQNSLQNSLNLQISKTDLHFKF